MTELVYGVQGWDEIPRDAVHDLIEGMRVRLNEYELYIHDDGTYFLDGTPLSDNHLCCILKRDIDAAGIKGVTGAKRDKVMRNVLQSWRGRLIANLVLEQKQVKTRVSLKFTNLPLQP